MQFFPINLLLRSPFLWGCFGSPAVSPYWKVISITNTDSLGFGGIRRDQAFKLRCLLYLNHSALGQVFPSSGGLRNRSWQWKIKNWKPVIQFPVASMSIFRRTMFITGKWKKPTRLLSWSLGVNENKWHPFCCRNGSAVWAVYVRRQKMELNHVGCSEFSGPLEQFRQGVVVSLKFNFLLLLKESSDFLEFFRNFRFYADTWRLEGFQSSLTFVDVNVGCVTECRFCEGNSMIFWELSELCRQRPMEGRTKFRLTLLPPSSNC